MSEKTVKVLQVLIGGDAFTGVASYLYQQYLHMDRERVHYDFLFTKKNSMKLVQEHEIFRGCQFIELGAVRGKNDSNDYFAITRGLKKVLSEGAYDYLVVNTSVVEVIYACLAAAKFGKTVPVIAHAHNTKIILEKRSIRNKIAGLVHVCEAAFRVSIRKKAAYLFACSKEAGAFTFGAKALESEKFQVINNAISLEKFLPDEEVRQSVRCEAGVTKEHVYGSVGYFCKRKNQLFLLDVFHELHKKDPESVLWIIGDGEYGPALKQRVEDLGIQKNVVFWGQRNDVPRLMQGMDCFVFPSLSEGLGIVAIEAQASGLLTFISDGVPKETMITQLCHQIPLEKDAEGWAQEILRVEEAQGRERRELRNEICEAGYDIQTQARKIMEFYMQERK